jgi:uncharacterized damage-inducible protein DinB
MEIVRHLLRLFAYDEWANAESLASLKAAGAPPARALRFMGHIIGAEWLWLGRINEDRASMPVWPDLTLEECEAQLPDLARHWRDFLDALTPAELSRRVEYINTKGERWANTTEDILTHVVIHSAYHRGQIATELRAAGSTPAYTDFIHCVRQGLIE